MNQANWEQFEKQHYLSLETFRKNGQGVATPVWFAVGDGAFYVTTMDNSGKVKRIRREGRVRIAPCDMRGELSGEWVEARARLVSDPNEYRQGKKLLNRKYGLKKSMFDLAALFMRTSRVMIAIERVDKK
jgi:PPOX class probable F420-dependent enzyme